MLDAFLQFYIYRTQAHRMKKEEEVILIGK